MKHPRVFSILLISAALVAPAMIAASDAAMASPVPALVKIRAAHHPRHHDDPGYDRVVFTFTGGLPSTRSVRYVSEVIADPSGLPVLVPGRAILQVTMSPTNAHDSHGNATVPSSIGFALPNVMMVVRSGDFEAVTSFGIGLAKREPVHVVTLRHPDRLVVDIQADFPTVQKNVWLFDQKRFADGQEPYFTPVLRPVLTTSPATGVMDRIFAGPLPAERRSGLRRLLSGATGFTKLRISHGVARVQLTGGCSSGGSTATIAGEIMPSLRQFSTVDFVKIYDPSGKTETPNGSSDSIPECLEP